MAVPGAPPVRRFVASLTVLLAAALVTGCDQTMGGTEGFVTGSGVVTLVEPAERSPAPEVAGTSLEGEPLTLTDFAGSVVVLNVWGSWCGPCRKEAPELVSAARQLDEADVRFLGINVRDISGRAAPRAFVDNFGIPYPSIYDPDSSTLLGFRNTLPPDAIPSTLVIDRRGRIAARVLGEVDESTLVDLVRDVADTDPSTTTGQTS